MAKPNFNQGPPLIHNDKEIYEETGQVDLLTDTQKNIMELNKPKNTTEIQDNVQNINQWYQQNTRYLKPHNTVNLNNLNKNTY